MLSLNVSTFISFFGAIMCSLGLQLKVLSRSSFSSVPFQVYSLCSGTAEAPELEMQLDFSRIKHVLINSLNPALCDLLMDRLVD